MNDYWDYINHGILGKEQKGHKYYARVPIGKNKLGFTQYRYFYDAREYGTYMTNLKNGKSTTGGHLGKGTTVYTTGNNKYETSQVAKTVDNSALSKVSKLANSASTNIKNAKSKFYKEVSSQHRSYTNHANMKLELIGKNGKMTRTNAANGKETVFKVNSKNYNNTMRYWNKRTNDSYRKRMFRMENVYQTIHTARRAKLAAQRGATKVKYLLSKLSKKK